MKRALIAVCSVAALAACTADANSLTAGGNESAPSTPAASAAATTGAEAGAAVKTHGDDYREVTIPAGTVLPVDLETSVGSDTSRAEQPVRGALRRPVVIGGAQVLPVGTAVFGHVTRAQRPGKIKGRGLIAMRFTEIDAPGEGRTRMSTASVSRIAPATKEKDALKIIAPAAGGAVVGRIVGGKKGAREGALIGGGAGTAYVLSTRGKDIRLGRGANLGVRLTAPLVVRVRR
jgi:hypothetical protein